MKIKNIVIVAVTAVCSLFAYQAYCCSNVIVTKGASKDGSILISYAADSHLLYGELYFHKAMNWPMGSMLDVYDWDSGKYLTKIPQVPHTYQTVGNMNQHQLIITETTFGGREELHDTTGRIDYGSLIYITLQRAKTAREAIKVISDLANEFGYYSEGESFSIADKNEAWIMELIGKGMSIKDGVNQDKGIVWVARRIPDGYICAHANQSRITTFPLNDPENCLYAPDVISFARKKGYFSGKDEDFSFQAAYCPLHYSSLRACEARVWSAFNIASKGKFIFKDKDGNEVTKSANDYLDYAMGSNPNNRLPLWIKPENKIGVKDLADIMRDHYEGTPMDMTKDIGAGGNACPYRWRPMTFKVGDTTYMNERALATQQTGFWMIGQSRSFLPDLIGGLLWFGTDDAATSYLTPLYTNILKEPLCFEQGNGDMLTYSATSSFWLNNRVANACYKMYNQMAPFVRKEIDRFENSQVSNVKTIDDIAMDLYRPIAEKLQKKAQRRGEVFDADSYVGKKAKKVKKFLTMYSCDTAQEQFDVWKTMEITLLVKFIDGNVKAQDKNGKFIRSKVAYHVPAGLTQPGYTDNWKKAVAKEHGEIVKVKNLK